MEHKPLLSAIICSIFLAACGQGSFQAVPQKIADFKGHLVNGEISSYQIEKGKATLVVLTASWCPGCRNELPHLKKLDNEFSEKGFKILLISEDDSPRIAARYNKASGITWTTFHWNYDIMNTLGNPGVIPVSYLINAQDSIVKVNVGEFSEKEMRSLIGKLVNSP
ncbi:TlpA disulfide reductase family protein [uncultured Fibrobacter sp.]|uniref:TlpA family protein disulfide reductase n=1 Tax=uncultured Fibrobacter sp. TaxID=261512 RepID=UPI0026388CA5|nr:TlpA disulfide reductase family protein [uncultured Fibrobacter sp.]